MSTDPHNIVVQREFTRQAAAYAANPIVSDSERIDRFLRAVNPSPDARVLDIATGPGYVAMGFAARCRDVVALDLTDAPLELARQMSVERGLTNLSWMPGDAAHLPFDDTSFDIVTCRLAFHHMEEPRRVVGEMARVCRPGGRVAVEDLVASEHPDRAAYQNHVEVLRDPSHVQALPLSALIHLSATAGLEIETVYMETMTQVAERWLANALTPPEVASEVYTLLERDAEHDLSGMQPVRHDGRLVFAHRTAVVVGRKLMR